MPTTRRTRGAVLAATRDDPMPRKPRSRATSIASSQRSNDEHHHGPPIVPAVVSRLASHNEELTAENEGLRQELKKQKSKRWTLRDQHLAEQLAEYHAQHPAEPEHKSQSAQSSAVVEKTEKDTVVAKQDTPPPAQTPVASKKVVTTATPEAPATVPRWRQLLTSLGGFSPFPARRSTVQRVATTGEQSANTGPALGELPQNRKRSAPEAQEQDTPSKKTKTPEPEDTRPSQISQSAPRALLTISEQAELPPQDFAVQTPTQPSRNMPPSQSERPARAAEYTPRRRTLKDVRAQQASRTPLPPSGLRRWETPSKPREPNADKRLARMQQLEKLVKEKMQMEEQIARLTAEQEADGIDTRKRKRVKVDELAYIPHNNPGDAKSTFRVPEWDSDDEMEVDEAVPVRQNVFGANADASPAKVAPPPAQPSAPEASQASIPPKSLFFKSVVPPQQTKEPPITTPTLPKVVPPVQKKAVFEPAAPSADLFEAATPSADLVQPKVPETSLVKPIASQSAPFKPATLQTLKKYSFPSVGARQPDEWPDAEKLAAGERFAHGFNSWLAVGLAV